MSTFTSATMLSAALLLCSQALPAHAQGTSAPAARTASAMTQQLHGHALASFRQGRFSEAYGRLMSLADAGHAPAAELALWMYQHGSTVFGKDWDSTPEQLASWAVLAGQPVRPMVATTYPRTVLSVAERKR